jgi:hypothetical protein
MGSTKHIHNGHLGISYSRRAERQGAEMSGLVLLPFVVLIEVSLIIISIRLTEIRDALKDKENGR